MITLHPVSGLAAPEAATLLLALRSDKEVATASNPTVPSAAATEAASRVSMVPLLTLLTQTSTSGMSPTKEGMLVAHVFPKVVQLRVRSDLVDASRALRSSLIVTASLSRTDRQTPVTGQPLPPMPLLHGTRRVAVNMVTGDAMFPNLFLSLPPHSLTRHVDPASLLASFCLTFSLDEETTHGACRRGIALAYSGSLAPLSQTSPDQQRRRQQQDGVLMCDSAPTTHATAAMGPIPGEYGATTTITTPTSTTGYGTATMLHGSLPSMHATFASHSTSDEEEEEQVTFSAFGVQPDSGVVPLHLPRQPAALPVISVQPYHAKQRARLPSTASLRTAPASSRHPPTPAAPIPLAASRKRGRDPASPSDAQQLSLAAVTTAATVHHMHPMETVNDPDAEIAAASATVPVGRGNYYMDASHAASRRQDFFMDITPLLVLPQKVAASVLGISESMFCKRFKELTRRKWPYRYLRKVDKLIHAKQGTVTTAYEQAKLDRLIADRANCLKPVSIRLSGQAQNDSAHARMRHNMARIRATELGRLLPPGLERLYEGHTSTDTDTTSSAALSSFDDGNLLLDPNLGSKKPRTAPAPPPAWIIALQAAQRESHQ